MCDSTNQCPLLEHPADYIPDTVDLTDDEEARDYWFKCFDQLVKKFSVQAAWSQRNDSTADERAANFYQDYVCRIEKLKANENQITERLTIRTLLDMNESCLRLYGFTDPWKEQKELENSASIKLLKTRLEELDQLEFNTKWIELFRGVLAGNVFDWGAHAVTQILQNDKSFGLDDALKCIQQRPWLIDGLDSWLLRIQGPPHTCAVIFVDNSGVDIILGMIPFARELLNRNTKVILCANTEPALNDTTYSELVDIIVKCCEECSIINKAYKDDKQLLIYPNGQSGPCLDLLNIPTELCDAILEHKADLIVIEGMGRALHTNLNAKFKCETLKMAVIKNEWLANRLGGQTFSVICKYETI